MNPSFLTKTSEKFIRTLNANLEKSGYVIFPSALSKSRIEEIFRQIEQILNAAIASASLSFDPRSTSLSQKYLLIKEHRPKLKSHCYDLIRYCDALHVAALEVPVIELLKSILGQTLLIDGIQVRIDDPTDDHLLPFHQEVFGQISESCLTFWCPLVDIDMENGPLRIVPGSHKRGKVPHHFKADFRNYHGVVEDVNEAEVKNIMLKAGDGLIFHPLLLHASSPNRSSRVRWTFITRYNSIQHVPYLESEDASSHIRQV